MKILMQNKQKLAALISWVSLIGGYSCYMYSNNLSATDSAHDLIALATDSLYGPLLFIASFSLCPLLFCSAALLTAVGGYLYGPGWGILYAIIGSNLSAMLAYTIGRYFGHGMVDISQGKGMFCQFAGRLRNNIFETVLISRFIFLPYDLINYLAGWLQIDCRQFILATSLGSLPGIISFTLLGASLEGDFNLESPELMLDPWLFGFALTLLVGCLAISQYLKRRQVMDLDM